MKRMNIFVLAVAVLCTTLVSANEPFALNPTKTISKQLEEILSDNSIDVEKNDALAKVLFKVNEEGKIEIVRINSERKDVKWFLNRKLKGKKLDVDNGSVGEVFVVEVRVTS